MSENKVKISAPTLLTCICYRTYRSREDENNLQLSLPDSQLLSDTEDEIFDV